MENYPCNNPNCQHCGNRPFVPPNENFPEPIDEYPPPQNIINRPPPNQPYPCHPGPPNQHPPCSRPCQPPCPPNIPPQPRCIEPVDDFCDFDDGCPLPPPDRFYNDDACINNEITDDYLLNYLLRKYKIDKQKLIVMLRKSRESDYKSFVMKKFYKENKNARNMQFREQYKIFKQWNNSGVYISKEELENYYENHIRCKN